MAPPCTKCLNLDLFWSGVSRSFVCLKIGNKRIVDCIHKCADILSLFAGEHERKPLQLGASNECMPIILVFSDEMNFHSNPEEVKNFIQIGHLCSPCRPQRISVAFLLFRFPLFRFLPCPILVKLDSISPVAISAIVIARPIASAGRLCPCGPFGMCSTRYIVIKYALDTEEC